MGLGGQVVETGSLRIGSQFENAAITMTMFRDAPFTVNLRSVDQLGAAGPAGPAGDIGAIDLR